MLLVFITRANITCATRENARFLCYQYYHKEQFYRISQPFEVISLYNFTLFLTIERLET